MIRLRHISTVLLFSLLYQQPLKAQEDTPTTDDGPAQSEGPADVPTTATPGGKAPSKPVEQGATT
ncbi:MAG: hypothetical protein EOP09_17045, partial [Proteobacteria bacterium]